ncbi:hypothetical protein Tco_1440581 [Tanacetum coccineum]
MGSFKKGFFVQCSHHRFIGITSTLILLQFFVLPIDQDALDSAAGGNFLDKMPRDGLAIIESKSKVSYSRSRAIEPRASTNAPLSTSTPSNSFWHFNNSPLLLSQMDYSNDPLREENSIFMEIPKPKAKKIVNVEIQDLNSPRPIPSKLPYPEMMKVRENDKPNAQHSRSERLFKQIRLEIGLKDALVEKPKLNKWLSSLLKNKEKLEEIAITIVNADVTLSS